MTTARVLRASLDVARSELRQVYTWRTWLFAWLVRVLAQATFFTLIGLLLDSPERLRYLIVGNAVMLAVIEAMFVVPSTTWERRTGSLPLLVAAPASTATTFVGRSLMWLPSGIATSSIALLALGPVFGVSWTPGSAVAAIGCVVVIACSTYCFGLVFAAVVLRAMDVRNVVSNVVWLSLMTVTGVQVPTSFWPAPVEWAAQVLPVTHGLLAVRMLAEGGADAGAVLARVGLEAAVGALWLVVAALLLRQLAESGRRDGSIEFAD